eukprot:sb/3473475/
MKPLLKQRSLPAYLGYISPITPSSPAGGELTKQFLNELNNANSDPNIPSTAVQSYNDSNIKTQKIIRNLQKKLRHLEEKKRRIREQDVLKGSVPPPQTSTGESTEEHRTTPEKKAGNLISGVYKKVMLSAPNSPRFKRSSSPSPHSLAHL